MTKAETAKLLTIIAAFDRRTIGETDVEAWHLVLGDLDADDCAAAVREYFTASSEWLMPAKVRHIAKTVERRREGTTRLRQLEQRIAAENPTGELLGRPLSALTDGTIKPVPRPNWHERQQLPARPTKPPLTAEELAAARVLLDEAREESA